jgi:hypothetical protein
MFVFIQSHLIGLDSRYFSRVLLTSETIFAQAPLAPNSIAHPHVREEHACATGKAPTTSMAEDAGGDKKRIPGPDDDCPICYDGMHGVAEASRIHQLEQCGSVLVPCEPQAMCKRLSFSKLCYAHFFKKIIMVQGEVNYIMDGRIIRITLNNHAYLSNLVSSLVYIMKGCLCLSL